MASRLVFTDDFDGNDINPETEQYVEITTVSKDIIAKWKTLHFRHFEDAVHYLLEAEPREATIRFFDYRVK